MASDSSAVAAVLGRPRPMVGSAHPTLRCDTSKSLRRFLHRAVFVPESQLLLGTTYCAIKRCQDQTLNGWLPPTGTLLSHAGTVGT